MKSDIKRRFFDHFHGKKLIRIQLSHTEPLSEVLLSEELQKLPLNPIPKDTLIIINDHDRSTPSAYIIGLLRKLEILVHPVTFIIASGTHTPMGIEEAIKISGKIDQDRVLIHDCRNEKDLVSIGATSRGTEISVEKIYTESKDVITINGVEPHYFAGFTGGVKSIIPGLAARDTVVGNHRWAITPESKILRTKGNPVFEDLWEGAALIRPLEEIASIQVVNHGDEIFYFGVGNLPDTFHSATDAALRIFGAPLKEKVDRIISFVADPLNKTLYQSQKAMENTKFVLKDGGTFVMVADAEKGVGNPLFFERLEALKTPKNIVNTLTFDNYRFGDHKAYYWAELADRVELQYVGQLSQDLVSKAFMKKITGEELIKNVEEWLAADEKVLVDEAGGITAAFLPQ